jgi:hypothetical protein
MCKPPATVITCANLSTGRHSAIEEVMQLCAGKNCRDILLLPGVHPDAMFYFTVTAQERHEFLYQASVRRHEVCSLDRVTLLPALKDIL